jgi:hypothetical protein
MKPTSRSRKSRTIFCAIVLGAIFLWFVAEMVVMTGTKASFSFVTVKSSPGGVSSTTTTTTTTTTTAASATSTPSGAGGR